MFEIFKLSKKKKETEHYIDLLNFKIQEMYKEIDSLEAKEEKSRKSAEIAEIAAKEARSVLDALNGKIHAIEEMQDYNIPYYQDSLDELEHKRYELQNKIESAVNTGLYRIEQNYTLNGSDKRGKEMQDVYGRGLCYAMSGYIQRENLLLI